MSVTEAAVRASVHLSLRGLNLSLSVIQMITSEKVFQAEKLLYIHRQVLNLRQRIISLLVMLHCMVLQAVRHL